MYNLRSGLNLRQKGRIQIYPYPRVLESTKTQRHACQVEGLVQRCGILHNKSLTNP